MYSSESVVYHYRRMRKSQWEQLLAEVALQDGDTQSSGHKRKASGDMAEHFATGSEHCGPRDELGWCGRGKYVFPHGVEYEGEFHDSCFHGKGALLYPSGVRIEGHWNKGRCLAKQIVFADGLPYDERNWGYCVPPDRRFVSELKRGLQPAGKSFLTDSQPTREIPENHFDTGDGFYLPKTNTVHDANDEHIILRTPFSEESAWIVKHCRKAWDEPVGFRPDLYEQWFDCRHATATARAPSPPPASPTDQYQESKQEYLPDLIEENGIS